MSSASSGEQKPDHMLGEPLFKIRAELDRDESTVEDALALWTESLRRLERDVPHNDILLEQTSFSYDVAYNLIAAEVNAALEAKEGVAKLRSELKEIE
jgi:hypothetical protein